jgi:hypothetical protein
MNRACSPLPFLLAVRYVAIVIDPHEGLQIVKVAATRKAAEQWCRRHCPGALVMTRRQLTAWQQRRASMAEDPIQSGFCVALSNSLDEKNTPLRRLPCCRCMCGNARQPR